MSKDSREKLEAIIRRAIDGGWTDYNSLESLELIKTTFNTVTLKGWVEFIDEGYADEAQTELEFNYKELIFNHDFTKALFKDVRDDTPVVVGPKAVISDVNLRLWQYHLQQAVISEDPIDYMYQSVVKH